MRDGGCEAGVMGSVEPVILPVGGYALVGWAFEAFAALLADDVVGLIEAAVEIVLGVSFGVPFPRPFLVIFRSPDFILAQLRRAFRLLIHHHIGLLMLSIPAPELVFAYGLS